MRYLLFAFVLSQTHISVSQILRADKNYPFQVLYAENTKNKSGQSLKSLDMVSITETLTVDEDGTLSFIHYTGYPIEVTGDTTLLIKDLQDLIVGSLNEAKKKNKNLELEKPNIEYLFITDIKSARKNKLSSAGACHDCDLEVVVTYPPQLTDQPLILASFENDFCIKWKSTNAKKYEIEIRSVFDDLVKRYYTSTNELTIDGKEITNLRGREKNLIIEIRDIENMKFSTKMLKEFPFQGLEFPYSCDIQKASIALLTGLALEKRLLENPAEAEKYFVLATTLSDKTFYREMLANFKKRNQQ